MYKAKLWESTEDDEDTGFSKICSNCYAIKIFK